MSAEECEMQTEGLEGTIVTEMIDDRKAASKKLSSVTAGAMSHGQKEEVLFLSSHIDELTEDIEEIQNSLLEDPRQKSDKSKDLPEEVNDLSPIFGKNAVSCWSVNMSHVLADKSPKINKENAVNRSIVQPSSASKTEKKLQEEYVKVKAKMNEYQKNSSTYLNEIKTLKEQLTACNAELSAAKQSKTKSKELEKEEKALYYAASAREVTECKRRIGDLEKMLKNSKEQILQLENKCLKLKLEKEQLAIKFEKKSPLIDYLKTGTIIAHATKKLRLAFDN